MIAVQISASDTGGGAAIAAFRIHRGLRRAGIDSRMLVAEKWTDDETVQLTAPRRTVLARLRHRLRSEIIARSFAPYKYSTHGCISDDRTVDPYLALRALPPADVYNLHWIAGFVDHDTFLRNAPKDTPLIWTLHDLNPLTGGCHYTDGCDRFANGCGACPVLGSDDPTDLSAQIFARKRAAYRRLRPELFRIVASSRWLADQASRSALFRQFDVCVIPLGVDTEMFRPRNRQIAREMLGLPPNVPIILFVAQSLQDHRKGMDLLTAALDGLDPASEVALVCVGAGEQAPMTRRRPIQLGWLNKEWLLSFAYSAADLFVTPARQEVFGQVVVEAMACGIPVVAFAVGGVPDIVRPGTTGLLAPAGDVRAMREAIEAILGDDERRARMSSECRRVALAEYHSEIQAHRYRDLYEDLYAAARATTHGNARFNQSAQERIPTPMGRARASSERPEFRIAALPRQVEGLDFTPVENGAIVYDPGSDRMHYLNGTAALVLELCDGKSDAAEIAGLLRDHFGLAERPRSEVEALLVQFLDEGLVVEG